MLHYNFNFKKNWVLINNFLSAYLVVLLVTCTIEALLFVYCIFYAYVWKTTVHCITG